jgi:hypothetical protein
VRHRGKVWAKISLQKTASIFNEKRLINQVEKAGKRFLGGIQIFNPFKIWNGLEAHNRLADF